MSQAQANDDFAVMQAVACSFCGSSPGQWCVGSGWPTRGIHESRRQDYVIQKGRA